MIGLLISLFICIANDFENVSVIHFKRELNADLNIWFLLYWVTEYYIHTYSFVPFKRYHNKTLHNFSNQVSIVFTIISTFVSSAYELITHDEEVINLDKSSMKIKKRVGLKIYPCGILVLINDEGDTSRLILNFCYRFLS